MFKRLKEKITEEVNKSPLRLQTVQTQIGQESSSSIMDVSESRQFSIADDDGASSATASPVAQSQKFENVDLTANASASMNSVARPRTSSVSSTGSQAPFFTVYSPSQSTYNIQSDLESASEIEDAGINLDIISKEQLYQAFQKAKFKYVRYKSRYGDLVKAYREQVTEKEKIKTILTESQDKALRRISELREQSQLDRKAKAHLEDSFRVTLEEKDELLRVLQTQVRLLKNGDDITEKQELDGPIPDDTNGQLVDVSTDSIKETSEGDTNESPEFKIKTYEETIIKLKRLLQNCKDTIVKHRDNNVRLAGERDQLNEKVNELNVQLNQFREEKSEKNKDMLNELLQASQKIENLKTKEAEDALSMAETKRMMHEEMENKEKELQEVKEQLQQLNAEKDELKNSVEEKLKEIAEVELKSRNEIEKAKLRLEEAEKTMEEDKQNLLQELSRGKAAAIQLMQQEADKRISEMEEEKSASLETLDREWQAKIDERVKDEVQKLVQLDALESTITMSDHFTNQIQTLKREVQEKEVQLKNLVEEKTVLQEEVQEQFNKLASLESELARSKQNFNVRETVVKVAAQFNHFRTWSDKMKEEMYAYKMGQSQQFSELNMELLKLSVKHESDLKLFEETIESLKLEKENYSKENVFLKDGLSAARQNSDQLEELLVNAKADVERLESQLSAESLALEKSRDNISVLKERLQKMEAEKDEVDQKITSLAPLSADLDLLRSQCRQLEGETESLNLVLQSKNGEIDKLMSRNEHLQNEIQALETVKADSVAIELQISSLEAELAAARAANEELENARNVANEQKESLEKEMAERRGSYDTHKEKLAAEIEQIRDKLRIESEKKENLLNSRSASAEKGCQHDEKLLQASQQFAVDLDNVKNDTENLKNEIDSLREQLSANKEEYELHVGRLGQEIEAKQLEVQQLHEKCKSGRADLETLQLSCNALSDEKADLMLQLNATKEELTTRSRATEELDVLRRDFGNCQNELLLKNGLAEELNAKLASMEDAHQHLQDEIVLKKLRETEFEHQISVLDSQIAELKEENSKLSAANRTLTEINTSQETKMATFEDRLRKAETERDEMEKSHKERMNELVQRFKSKLKSVNEKNKEYLAQFEREKAEMSRLSGMVENLGNRESQLKSENEQLDSRLAETVLEHERSKSELLALRERLNLAVAERETYEILNRNFESVSAENQTYKEQIEEISRKLETVFAENQTYKGRIEEHSRNRELDASESQKYRDEIEQLRRDFDSALLENRKYKEQIEGLAHEFETVQDENLTYKEQIQEFVRNLESFGSQKQDLANYEGRVLTLESTLDCRNQELEKLNEEIKSNRDAREQAKNELRAITSQYEKLKSDFEEAVSVGKEAKEQINTMQSALASKNNEVGALQVQLKELNEQKVELERKIVDERDDHENELKLKLQQVNEENQSKLAELRKRAENKLAQIKKQLVYDADKAKDELQTRIADLEERKRRDDEDFSEKIKKERENVKLEFEEKIVQLENSLEELKATLESSRTTYSDEKENLLAELAVKDSQIDESLINAQANHVEMLRKIGELQAELEQSETNLRNGEAELAELRQKLAEKEEMVDRLRRGGEDGDASEYERRLKGKDEEHAIKIKQLVKEFSKMISLKEEEGRQALAKAIETSLNDENRLRREHNQHLNEIQNEFGEKEQSLEQILEERENIIQEKSAELERCSHDYEEKMDVMKTEHQRQMQELEKKWKAMLRKELKQQAAIHEEEVSGLSHEWQLERKLTHGIDSNSIAKIDVTQEELQQQTHLASSAIESGGQSSELLRRQIMTMQTQMEMLKDRHKAEVGELHQILQASNCPVPSTKSVGKGIFRDRPALESLEIEYLKNILFEYMMGRETLTLAKVIATVVQFSEEQLTKILEREESRGGGQLVPIWK